jgi:hypothetical protein
LAAIASGDIFKPLDVEPDDYVYDNMKYPEHPKKYDKVLYGDPNEPEPQGIIYA